MTRPPPGDRPPLPDTVLALTDSLQRGVAGILGRGFAGLFLYGALAFPRPERWLVDVDFHVLVQRPLTDAERGDLRAVRASSAGTLGLVDVPAPDEAVVALRELDVDPGDVIEVPGLLDLTSLWQVYGVDRPALKDPPFVPATPPAFAERETPKSIFSTFRDGVVLVHHPYDSFSTTVQRFIEQAAADPNVLAIKQTLYRTSGDSPIVNALIDAAEAGKQVVALVEIKARFDEQANIKWARQLEQAGVHVVYGLIGLKTLTSGDFLL